VRAGLEGNVKQLLRKAREDACMDVSKYASVKLIEAI